MCDDRMHAGLTAVASFGRGTWSFREFLEHRQKVQEKLKCEFEASIAEQRIVLTENIESKANIYVEHEIGQVPSVGRTDLTWLSTFPILGRPIYPAFLDLIDAARAVSPSRLVATAAAALAPTWEELEEYGLANAGASKPRWDDVQGGDDNVMERYLLTMAARSIVSLGSDFGVVLRSPERLDRSSALFAQKLLHEARITGFHVALDGSSALLDAPRYRDYLRDAQVIVQRPRQRHVDRGAELVDRAATLLACCPHGAPLSVVNSLGGDSRGHRVVAAYTGGELRAFASGSLARAARTDLTSDKRRALQIELYDAWPTEGWSYARRAGLAISARDTARMLAQHTGYNYGLAEIGQEFLLRQFSALSLCTVGKNEPETALYSAVGAARLAARAPIIEGPAVALRHYKRGIRLTADPAIRADLIYGIINVLAHQRLPESLCQARRWHRRGKDAARNITNNVDKVFAAIRLANGLGLVAYHQGCNKEALALEEEAREIAVGVADTHPEITQWAIPVINANTAKLLEKRLARVTEAIELLKANMSASEAWIHRHARLELARIYFDRQEYLDVVDMLDSSYNEHSTEFDEEQELFARLLLAFSLTFLGSIEKNHRKLGRLSYLVRSLNNRNAAKFFSAICFAAKDNGVALDAPLGASSGASQGAKKARGNARQARSVVQRVGTG